MDIVGLSTVDTIEIVDAEEQCYTLPAKLIFQKCLERFCPFGEAVEPQREKTFAECLCFHVAEMVQQKTDCNKVHILFSLCQFFFICASPPVAEDGKHFIENFFC